MLILFVKNLIFGKCHNLISDPDLFLPVCFLMPSILD